MINKISLLNKTFIFILIILFILLSGSFYYFSRRDQIASFNNNLLSIQMSMKESDMPFRWLTPIGHASKKESWMALAGHYITTNPDGRGGVLLMTNYPYAVINNKPDIISFLDRLILNLSGGMPTNWFFLDDIDLEKAVFIKPD